MKFHCSRCGQKLTVPDDAAGERHPCPSCGEPLVVPPARAPLPPPPRRPAAPSAAIAAIPRRKTDFSWLGSVLICGLLLAGGATAYEMHATQESPDQIWKRWGAIVEAKLGLPPAAAPTADGVSPEPVENSPPVIATAVSPPPAPIMVDVPPAVVIRAAAAPSRPPLPTGAALSTANASAVAPASPARVSNTPANALDTLIFGNPHSETQHALVSTGSAIFQNELTLYGPGNIWDSADSLIFRQQKLSGDGWIQARVTSTGEANGWTKVGVMMRETLDANAKNVFMFNSTGEGVHSQWRENTGGGTGQGAYQGPGTEPFWVRVERQGNAFLMSVSTDGQIWTEVTRMQIIMDHTIYMGLVNSASSLEKLNYATFDHITVSTAFGPWTNTDIGKSAIHGGSVVNGLGEPSRRLLPQEPNYYYGGELTFRMMVDPDQQNYCTVKLWGAEGGDKMGRIALTCEGKEVGKRHGPGLDIFIHTDGPLTAGAFWYRTTILPRWLTRGKTSVEIKLRSMGSLFAYGSPWNYDTYQNKLDHPTRGLYRLYTHTNPALDTKGEVQGAVPDYTHAPMRPPPDERAELDRRKEDSNNHLRDLLTKNDPSQNDAATLAEAYGITWTLCYQKNAALAQIIKALDALGQKYHADHKLAAAEWGGNFGPAGYALALVAPAIEASLNETVDLGAGPQPRRDQYAAMLKESRDSGRFGRQSITNQALINAGNIYRANRGMLALGSRDALPDPAAKRYYREAAGMEEWRGDDLPTGGSKWNLGHGIFMMTAKGTSHEWNWCCANCYGRMDPYVYEMFRFTGDVAFRDRAIQIEHAHDYMVYPSVDEGGYRAMLNEGVICTRNVYHPGETFYGYANVAASLADTALLGGVKQGMGDRQFLGSWQPSETTLFFPDDYARLKTASNFNKPLPTTPGQPDFAWADEQNAVLSIKHGAEQHFLTFARRASSIHHIGDAHSITPQGERVVQFWVDDVRFTPSGQVEKIGPEVQSEFCGVPPDHPVNAWAGQEQPKAKPEFGSPGGMADFYSARYGDFLIAMNCTYRKNFEFNAEDMMGGVDLVSGQRMILPVQVPPQSTVVFFAPVKTASAH